MASRVTVDVVVPTRSEPAALVTKALSELTYPVGRVLVQRSGSLIEHENPFFDKYLNAAATRNAAREVLLRESRADFTFFLDDDVVPPADVIEQLLFIGRPVVGGWYPLKGRTDRWVAGLWVGDGSAFNHCGFPRVCKPSERDWAPYGCMKYFPKTGRREMDPWISGIAPLGCVLVAREVMELIPFRAGINEQYYDVERKGNGILGDCGAFADDLLSVGESVAMSHRVVCEHVAHEK